jgi:hypothetical protein
MRNRRCLMGLVVDHKFCFVFISPGQPTQTKQASLPLGAVVMFTAWSVESHAFSSVLPGPCRTRVSNALLLKHGRRTLDLSDGPRQR